jgi:hypothetical protein
VEATATQGGSVDALWWTVAVVAVAARVPGGTRRLAQQQATRGAR